MNSLNRLGLLALCLSASAAVTIPVSIVDYQFQPDSVTLVPGDSVAWTNNGAAPHTSTSGVNGVPDGIWDSGTLNHGQTYARRFINVGRFPYYCTFHYMSGMVGVVRVVTAGIGQDESPASSAPALESRPNPFRTATTFSYRLRTPGHAELRIHNAAGELVRTLAIGRAAPGAYSFTWDGANDQHQTVSEGTYLCQLRAGSQIATTILLRLN